MMILKALEQTTNALFSLRAIFDKNLQKSRALCTEIILTLHIFQFQSNIKNKLFLGRPIFWSLSQKIKQLRRRSVGCVN